MPTKATGATKTRASATKKATTKKAPAKAAARRVAAPVVDDELDELQEELTEAAMLVPIIETEAPEDIDLDDGLGDFGEVDQSELEDLDAPPIPFSITGYEARPDPTTGIRRPHKFTFLLRPDLSFGKIFSMIQQMDAKGNVPVHVGATFIADALIYEQREDWLSTLARPDLEFHSTSIQTLTQKLAERYGLRPTERLPEPSERPLHSGRTTTGVRSARKSGSANSRRRTR